jgi:hypothetical protein
MVPLPIEPSHRQPCGDGIVQAFEVSAMKALLLTNEYPPNVYGGAGVHVEFLSRDLAKLIGVEVRSFGDQDVRDGNLVVRGYGLDDSGFTAPSTL